MFGKLLKNDIKAQWHSMSAILLCIIIVSVIAELVAFLVPNQKVQVIGGLVFIFAAIVSCIVVVIAVGMMFSKTVFGRAGYLTLTLPVKTRSLVWSKTVSGLLWVSLVYAILYFSIYLFIYQISHMDGAEELLEVLEELSTLAWGLSAEVVIFFIVYALLYVAISIFALVQCIYFAITCSNVSPISKLGNLGTVIITLVSLSLLTSLSDRLGNMFPFGTFFDGEVITFTTNVYYTFNKADEVGFQFIFSSPIFMAIFSCLSNIPITYMIKNKVNIK